MPPEQDKQLLWHSKIWKIIKNLENYKKIGKIIKNFENYQKF